MMQASDYIPHGLVAALGAVVSWVYKDHVKRDDARFDAIQATFDSLGAKLDNMTSRIADNHTEVLNRLLDAKAQAKTDFTNR